MKKTILYLVSDGIAVHCLCINNFWFWNCVCCNNAYLDQYSSSCYIYTTWFRACQEQTSKTSFSSCIHAIRDKVRFSSISFLKIVLHSFAQNNDLVRIFRSIFFALVDKLRTKSWLPFLALPINANVISWATSPFWNSIHAVQFIHELLHGRYDLTNPLPRTPAHRR